VVCVRSSMENVALARAYTEWHANTVRQAGEQLAARDPAMGEAFLNPAAAKTPPRGFASCAGRALRTLLVLATS